MIQPSYPAFCRWLKSFSLIPLWLALPKGNMSDPFLCFQEVAKRKNSVFLLDSFNTLPNCSYSYFPLAEPEALFTAENQNEFARRWSALKNFMRLNKGPSLSASLPPFYGGAVGVLSYDCGRFFEKGWKSAMPKDPLSFPLIYFGIYFDLACFDHKQKQIFLFTCAKITRRSGSNKEIYQESKRKLIHGAQKFQELLSALPPSSPPPPTLGRGTLLRFSSPLPARGPCGGRGEEQEPAPYLIRGEDESVRRQHYLDSVRKIKGYIAAGDIYQANLSQRIELILKGSSVDFFGRLRKINPSPYACFFRFPGYEVVSCSPELLLKKRGKVLKTRPIAGTRPRGADLVSDDKMSADLLLNEKERAEHVMLLDLERNDLGRVCKSGTVQVTERMGLEKYSHVMHIVSEVCGRLKERESIFGALAAVFPGGTITGCPKVRCMEILDEVELLARGPFFGSAGWIGFQGDGEFNLLIRTAVIQKEDDRCLILDTGYKKNKKNHSPASSIQHPASRVFIQVGSGIVADSAPEFEYEESLHKARALLDAIKVKG